MLLSLLAQACRESSMGRHLAAQFLLQAGLPVPPHPFSAVLTVTLKGVDGPSHSLAFVSFLAVALLTAPRLRHASAVPPSVAARPPVRWMFDFYCALSGGKKRELGNQPNCISRLCTHPLGAPPPPARS